MLIRVMLICILSVFCVTSEKQITLFMIEQLRCGEKFCENIICEPVKNCLSGEIIHNASLCGCCDQCILFLDEGESCEDVKVPPKGISLKKCKNGLQCVNNICTRSETISCETIAKSRLNLKTDPDIIPPFSNELWIPDCNEKGLFEAKQCKKKKCICVAEDGEKLFGQEEKDLAENMTCGCSRTMDMLQKKDKELWMTKVQERCTHTGDYNTLQCVDKLCFCSDPITGEVLGQITKIAFMELLPCYDEKEHGKRYETQCDLQLTSTRSLRYQFYQKNIEILGLEHANCDVDGSFSPKQCQTDRCVCTDRKGNGMKSYSVEKSKKSEEMGMTCNCARDEHAREVFRAHYPRMLCNGAGNFEPFQCFDTDKCYCVDEDGDVISERVSPMDTSTDDCKRLLLMLRRGNADEPLTTTEALSTDEIDGYSNEIDDYNNENDYSDKY